MSTNEPKRGEIWLADLEPTRGAEIAKTRPVLVMSPEEVGRLPLRVIVPVTEWKSQYASYPWMVQIDPTSTNGLFKASAADAFQVRSLSLLRFAQLLGVVGAETTDAVAVAIAVTVGLPETP